MNKILPTAGIVASFIWFWNSRGESFSPNPGEALGFNMVVLGLPLLLLFYCSRRLYRILKQEESPTPIRIIFGMICGSATFCSLLDLINPTAAHRVGAAYLVALCGITALILLISAYRARRPNQRSSGKPTTSLPIP